MSKPIKREKAKIWNERFEQKMKERNLTQRKFIEEYNLRFEKGRQSDVSNWMHVGEKDNRTKKLRGFPKFETMCNIAEILEVDVGYLIGETDCKTYELDEVSNYIGLSESTIESICEVTSGKAIPPFFKYPDERVNSTLELFLSSDLLVEYMKNIYDVAVAKSSKPYDHFNSLLNKIPESYREEAFSLWEDEREAISEKKIEPSEILWFLVDLLHDAACEDMYYEELKNFNKEVKGAKYALQETQIKMLDKLLSEENLQKLLNL